MFTLLSFYTRSEHLDYQPVADLTLPNRKAYCDKHGYGFEVCAGPHYFDPNLYYGTQAMHRIYDLMFVENASVDDPDWFVWFLTIPGVVMNHNRRLEEFVDGDHDFFIHEDIHGINGASFIIRKSEWSKNWLEMIMREAPHVNHCWHEQRVMQLRAGEPEWRDKIKILEHPGINSYFYDWWRISTSTPGHYNPGDFVLSLPGTSMEERISLITSERVQNNIIL